MVRPIERTDPSRIYSSDSQSSDEETYFSRPSNKTYKSSIEYGQLPENNVNCITLMIRCLIYFPKKIIYDPLVSFFSTPRPKTSQSKRDRVKIDATEKFINTIRGLSIKLPVELSRPIKSKYPRNEDFTIIVCLFKIFWMQELNEGRIATWEGFFDRFNNGSLDTFKQKLKFFEGDPQIESFKKLIEKCFPGSDKGSTLYTF